MKQALVTDVFSLGGDFYWITLESSQFRNVTWTPGDKLQISLGSAFVTRTYTPVEWDAQAGRTRILACAHAAGPGSDWVRSVKAGDECDVFGPRSSLDISVLKGPVLFFGDETSFGLGLAMTRLPYADDVSFFFEVDSVETSEAALAQMAFGDWWPLARRSDYGQLDEIESVLPQLDHAYATFVITGKAMSVQLLRKALKRLEVPSVRILTKAYWADGKCGLD